MKVCVFQSKYSFDAAEGEACFNALLKQLDACDSTMDVIVLPEYSDLPYDEKDPERFVSVSRANGIRLDEKVKETALRCGAVIFYNRFDFTETGMRNTTFAVNKEGIPVGKYVKEHPAPSEEKSVAAGGHGLDVSYSYTYRKPTILEIDGVRYGFITCFDAYFYEYYSVLAKQKPDVIIACSLQRTDTHEVLETFGKFLSYNVNAYLLRASVSLGADSPACGCAMAAAPNGSLLLNMKNDVGLGTVNIDVTQKYAKPAGFGGKPKPHPAYTEVGRRPWLYRPAGSFIVPNDDQMPYPRICAHRGFNTAIPENSMPAFGAAVALGAQEIEFDVWATKDGELVSLHDAKIDRTSNGAGHVSDYTYEELLQFDFGAGNPAFKGLKIVRFEDILRRFSCQTIMNIHVKIWRDEPGEKYYHKIGDLLEQYDCDRHAYVMSRSDRCLEEFHALYPQIHRCKGYDGDDGYVDDAIRLGVEKVQLFKPFFDEASVRRAHAHGVKCNVFYADDPEEAKRYLEMGIDCILTNDYLQVKNATEQYIQL